MSADPAAAAPSGVVTFLFTDVEGSTRRWESDAQAMRAALVVHDKVLRTAIEAYDGFLLSHTGDGFVAAFASPMSAVNAAIDAQRELQLPVRMGLATGEAELRDGGHVLKLTDIVDSPGLPALGDLHERTAAAARSPSPVGDHPPRRVKFRATQNVLERLRCVGVHLDRHESRCKTLGVLGMSGNPGIDLCPGSFEPGPYPGRRWNTSGRHHCRADEQLPVDG